MKQCVITGAAEGIGRALAERYAQAGYAVTGIDINAEQAQRTAAAIRAAGGTIRFLPADLSERAECARVAGELAAGPPLDVLIHNAGISAVGRFGRVDLERQRAVLALNLAAPMLLTNDLLGLQHITAGGSLVFIASLACFTGYPGAAAYAASKDGLAAYARSLRVGLGRRGIHVLTVYPGPTRTAHARRYSPDNRREQRRMAPERLAAAILESQRSRRRTLIPGWGNRLFAALGLLAPRLTEALLERTLLDKLDG